MVVTISNSILLLAVSVTAVASAKKRAKKRYMSEITRKYSSTPAMEIVRPLYMNEVVETSGMHIVNACDDIEYEPYVAKTGTSGLD